jgi:hypothetical protein
MVKMTYVPNTIRILSHRVDLWHHILRFRERIPNRQWSCCKVKRGEGGKKERRKKEKGRDCPILHMSHVDRYDATGLT